MIYNNWFKLHHGYAWNHDFRRLPWQELLLCDFTFELFLFNDGFIHLFQFEGKCISEIHLVRVCFHRVEMNRLRIHYFNDRSEANLHMIGCNVLFFKCTFLSKLIFFMPVAFKVLSPFVTRDMFSSYFNRSYDYNIHLYNHAIRYYTIRYGLMLPIVLPLSSNE